MAPDNNLDKKFDRLLRMVKQWSDRIRTLYLRKYDTVYALKDTVLVKIEYALPTLNLIKAQCNCLMRPILQAILEAGYNWHFPIKVIHGSNRLMGANIHHPHHPTHCAHPHATMAWSTWHNHRTATDGQYQNN
jgi:hypothetical protein